MTGTGGSPQPLGASVLGTMYTSTATGASFMYAGVRSGNHGLPNRPSGFVNASEDLNLRG
jgi:hypothetical protein